MLETDVCRCLAVFSIHDGVAVGLVNACQLFLRQVEVQFGDVQVTLTSGNYALMQPIAWFPSAGSLVGKVYRDMEEFFHVSKPHRRPEAIV